MGGDRPMQISCSIATADGHTEQSNTGQNTIREVGDVSVYCTGHWPPVCLPGCLAYDMMSSLDSFLRLLQPVSNPAHGRIPLLYDVQLPWMSSEIFMQANAAMS